MISLEVGMKVRRLVTVSGQVIPAGTIGVVEKLSQYRVDILWEAVPENFREQDYSLNTDVNLFELAEDVVP